MPDVFLSLNFVWLCLTIEGIGRQTIVKTGDNNKKTGNCCKMKYFLVVVSLCKIFNIYKIIQK